MTSLKFSLQFCLSDDFYCGLFVKDVEIDINAPTT